MNGTEPIIDGDQITFSYATSLGESVTETLPVLSADEIVSKVEERHERFVDAGAGARESEISRAERKYISAHPIEILREAFNSMDETTQHEFGMMFDQAAHFGHSDLNWLEENLQPKETVVGDNQEPLDMPAKSGKQLRFMQMAAHNPSKMKKAGPSPEVAKEFIKKSKKKKKKHGGY